MQRDPVWYDDIGVLPRKWAEFFPRASMTTDERTNAYVRLVLYVTLALYLYNRDARGVVFGFVLVAVLSALHRKTIEPYAPALPATSPDTTASSSCKKSTPDNPFANYLLTDNPDDPPACAYDDHKDLVRENFNRNLFRNPEDLFEKQNSQRQFFSMPHGKVPDTKAFAEFLSGGTSRRVCKEDTTACTGFRG
jgi:hypothetical protein